MPQLFRLKCDECAVEIDADPNLRTSGEHAGHSYMDLAPLPFGWYRFWVEYSDMPVGIRREPVILCDDCTRGFKNRVIYLPNSHEVFPV